MVLSALINSFKENTVIPFIGSGFSANFGFPMFNQLLSILKDDGLVDANHSNYFDGLETLQKSQYLVDINGRKDVITRIKQALPRLEVLKDFTLYEKLFRLPLYKIYTTNWDKLLEHAYTSIKKAELNCIWKENQFKTNRELELIKIHGTIDDFESIIFTEKDYFNFISRKSFLHQQLQVDLASKNVLFIGYSLNDINLKLIINQIKTSLGEFAPKIYMFCPNYSDHKIELLKKNNIDPICINAPTHTECLQIFLDELVALAGTIADTATERATMIERENSFFRNKANLIIRNSSNLGPLSTPLNEKVIYANEELTTLEKKCTQNWIKIIENHGNKANCIISLDEQLLFSKYDKDILMKRLLCLRENILKYNDKVLFADRGYVIDSHLEIYGNEVLIESRKRAQFECSYQYSKVIRDPYSIREEIINFDSMFSHLQKYHSCFDNTDVLHKIEILLNKL